GSFEWPHPSRLQPKESVNEKQVRMVLNYQFKKCIRSVQEFENKTREKKNEAILKNDRQLNLEKIITGEKKLQCLLFLLLHMKRHVEQMQKIENEFLNKN
ncbi:MAG: hypothetical protein IAF38_12440, partial [Bacteroidia bacterium]|nr:hypothetical protein [Bacteroidia bacterium]